jgi:hypothetical protein
MGWIFSLKAYEMQSLLLFTLFGYLIEIFRIKLIMKIPSINPLQRS